MKIAVIAGDPVDMAFGAEIFKAPNLEIIKQHTSKNSNDQSKLEAFHADKLTIMLVSIGKKMERAGCRAMIIYCNSMSGAANIKKVRKSVLIPVITPHDVYEKIAKKHNKFAVMAADSNSASHIEKTLKKFNPKAKFISYANLGVVNDIENKKLPIEIIKNRNILEFIDTAEKSGAEVLILGCTHFPYFYKELKGKVKIPIFEPSAEMEKILKSKLKM